MAGGFAVTSALGLAMLVAIFASCATADTSSPRAVPEDASVLPEASPAPTDDAGPDAGCDPDASDCTITIPPCDQVAWCTVPTGVSVFYELAAVWGSSASDVWAVGSGGTIIHYDGTSWTPTPSGVRNTFYGVWGSGPNEVYVVSSTAVILRGNGMQPGGGTTWELLPTPLVSSYAPLMHAVWGSGPNDVRVGGRPFDGDPKIGFFGGDQLLKSTLADGSTTWRPVPGGQRVMSIWGSSANDVWMTAEIRSNEVDEPGTFHGTRAPDAGVFDGGVFDDPLTWTPVDSQRAFDSQSSGESPPSITLESVWGSSASDVWAVGSLGTIRHITPADEHWQEVASPTKVNLHGIWGSGPNDIWAVGDAGTILHYDGKSFTVSTAQLPLGKKPPLNGIWGSGPNDVWIVGDRVTLHYTGGKK
jgi:hypothetical protein